MSLSFSDMRSRVSTVLHRKDLSICTALVFYLGVFTVAATGLLFYATNPEYFERSVEDHSLVAMWLRNPEFDWLRPEPRFRALFERMGLNP